MIIIPLENFKIAGTCIQVDKGKEYHAKWATNVPNWSSLHAIYVINAEGDFSSVGMRLNCSEYALKEISELEDLQLIYAKLTRSELRNMKMIEMRIDKIKLEEGV